MEYGLTSYEHIYGILRLFINEPSICKYIMNDKFWFEDPSILIKEDRLKEFFPIKNMTTIEKLNSIMRLTIIISLLLYLICGEYIYLYSIIILILACYLIGG